MFGSGNAGGIVIPRILKVNGFALMILGDPRESIKVGFEFGLSH